MGVAGNVLMLVLTVSCGVRCLTVRLSVCVCNGVAGVVLRIVVMISNRLSMQLDIVLHGLVSERYDVRSKRCAIELAFPAVCLYMSVTRV